MQKAAKRVLITVAGGVLLLVGAALLVLPGPGIPLVIAGLALLASEFKWAHDAHQWVKRHAHELFVAIRARLRRRRDDAA